MATNTGTVMTIANSIIGVSVLAMPFCFKQCGIVLSIVMLILSSMLTRLTCYLLLKSAVMSRRRTFEYLAFHIFGPTGKFLTELCIIGYLMGTCIAFFVIVGDLGPEIISESLEITNSPALRPSFMICLALLVILPLGLLRNVDSLSSVCIASIGFYFCLVLKVFFEALPHLVSGIWLEKVHYWRPAGVLQCLPIFSGALFCQMTLFEIYESLPNPSLERMNAAVHAAINMCTVFYISVGFLGYVAFCTEPFGGNILMSFLPSVMSDLFKFGFVLSLAVSFPLVIFPCRVSLNSLIYRRIQGPQHESTSAYIPDLRFKCLTSIIIALSLAVGLIIPNIELVLGLVGSTIGVAICVMFPALAFIFVSTKRTADRATAQFLLGAGVVILVLGTYATLSARSQTEIEVKEHLEVKLGQPPLVERLDVAAVVAAVEGKKEEPLVVVARREPPVPQESAGNEKDRSEHVEVIQKDKSEKVEVIHKDALKKEDEELAAAEKQDNGESHQKNEELLRKIEKNKEEQEKLLQEQKALILGLQKDSARKAESAERKKVSENEVNKAEEKFVKDKSVVKLENKRKEIKPDAFDFKEQLPKEPVIVQEPVKVESENDGVIVKPASQDRVDIDNSLNGKDLKQDDTKIESVPQAYEKQEQLPKQVADKPVEVKPSELKAKPLRNMTIKSIIMPNFANKIPNPRAEQKSENVPAAKKAYDIPNKSNELDIKLEVDKIISADILKNNVVDRLSEGKSNQRDILSADEEKRLREKRDADLAASAIQTVKLSSSEVANDEGNAIGEAPEDCLKADKDLTSADEKSLVVDSVPVASNPVSLGGNASGSGVETLIKVSARLTDPELDPAKVAVPALVAGLEEVADESKPRTRDLKSFGAQSGGNINITKETESKEAVDEKIEI